MIRLTEIKLPLDHDQSAFAPAICAKLGIEPAALRHFTIARRAIDARRKSAIALTYSLDVAVDDEAEILQRCRSDKQIGPTPDTSYRPITPGHPRSGQAKARPIVIGTGPCGLFAALILAQAGLRPIILDRGKMVRERTKDTWAFWRRAALHPESNVQFGEGGAGTFSDGKLYSQISDPQHLGRKVLTEFVAAGAPPEIL
ncbi:MAG TPA: FAD-dependent monooxygenase, partial [Acetobacteraceae bacterium]|nr:FAD-dependent monooxygenase [Acetobacteraceae bacterium]